MQTNVGPETVLKAQVIDGKIEFSADYVGKNLSSGAFIAATPEQICSALAGLIPGDSAAEHAALAVVKMALEAASKLG